MSELKNIMGTHWNTANFGDMVIRNVQNRSNQKLLHDVLFFPKRRLLTTMQRNIINLFDRVTTQMC